MTLQENVLAVLTLGCKHFLRHGGVLFLSKGGFASCEVGCDRKSESGSWHPFPVHLPPLDDSLMALNPTPPTGRASGTGCDV